MENRREKAYRFSYCLYAYIYKDIHEKRNLPLAVNYVIPSTTLFKREVGDCVLNVCRVHRKFLEPVFTKVFPTISTSEAYFFEYVRWYYEKIVSGYTEEYNDLYAKFNFEPNAVGPFFIKLLTLCSFIAELVRYCFGQKCYSFTSSAPTSIAEIILTIPELNEYFSSLTNAFVVFNRFCYDVMNDTAINANSLCDLFMQQSDILMENCSISLLKNSLPLLAMPASTKTDNASCTTDGATRQHIKRKSDSLTDKSYDMILTSINDLDTTEGTERQYVKRKSDSLTDKSYDMILSKDLERSPKISNNFAEDLAESKLSVGKRCPNCNEACLIYLEDFIEDFKETNYVDE